MAELPEFPEFQCPIPENFYGLVTKEVLSLIQANDAFINPWEELNQETNNAVDKLESEIEKITGTEEWQSVQDKIDAVSSKISEARSALDTAMGHINKVIAKATSVIGLVQQATEIRQCIDNLSLDNAFDNVENSLGSILPTDDGGITGPIMSEIRTRSNELEQKILDNDITEFANEADTFLANVDNELSNITNMIDREGNELGSIIEDVSSYTGNNSDILQKAGKASQIVNKIQDPNFSRITRNILSGNMKSTLNQIDGISL